MKTFQFKDLMINVAPSGEKGAPAGVAGICGPVSCLFSCWASQCTLNTATLYTPFYAGETICPFFSCPLFSCVFSNCTPQTGPQNSQDTCLAAPIGPGDVKNQLAAVKTQLQAELAAIEQREKAVAETLRPNTVAEVEELQGKLREAIAELDKRKQELRKAEKSGNK